MSSTTLFILKSSLENNKAAPLVSESFKKEYSFIFWFSLQRSFLYKAQRVYSAGGGAKSCGSTSSKRASVTGPVSLYRTFPELLIKKVSGTPVTP